MDGWKMKIPIGFRPIFRCELLVSGMVSSLTVKLFMSVFFRIASWKKTHWLNPRDFASWHPWTSQSHAPRCRLVVGKNTVSIDAIGYIPPKMTHGTQELVVCTVDVSPFSSGSFQVNHVNFQGSIFIDTLAWNPAPGDSPNFENTQSHDHPLPNKRSKLAEKPLKTFHCTTMRRNYQPYQRSI